jgi:hypothetical protein
MRIPDRAATDEVEHTADEADGVYCDFTDLNRQIVDFRGGADAHGVLASRARRECQAYLMLAEEAFSRLADACNAEFDELAHELIKQHKERTNQ